MSVLRMVFGWSYVLMAVAITASMTFLLLYLSEFIFLEPNITGHIPQGTEVSFVLVLAISVLSGLVIPMNVYRIMTVKVRSTGGFMGSFVGAVAGACSCGPAGFAIISTFGGVGAITTAFLANYEVPIRAAALAILCVSWYMAHRSLRLECGIRQC